MSTLGAKGTFGQTAVSAKYRGVTPATSWSPDCSSRFLRLAQGTVRSRGANEAELLQGRYPIVKTDFLEDLSVLEF
jgi:hypothetical protein